MIDLAIALALQDAGFGTYGEDLFWSASPIMANGQVTAAQGIWVNSTPVEVAGDWYHDQLTITTRFNDAIKQGITLVNLLAYCRDTLTKMCELSTDPIVKDFAFEQVDITPPSGIAYEGTDTQGRWVKSIALDVKYKLPDNLPSIG